MKRLLLLMSLLCTAGLLSTPAAAQHIGLAAKASTLGPGIEMTVPLSRSFTARLGGNHLTYAHSDFVTDLEVAVSYNADLTMTSATALVDYYPFKGRFRLSAGAVYNSNGLEAVLTPTENYTVEDKTFTPERLGTLSAELDYASKINPYLGFGIGNAALSRFGMALDLGVIYTGSPRFTMEGTGMIAPTANQAADIEASLQSFKFYPVVSLAVSLGL